MKSFLTVLFTAILATAVHAVTAQLDIMTGTAAIEVGEEIVFTGLKSTDNEALIHSRFEWMFGDGYTLQHGDPWEKLTDEGATVLHFYMRPGTFTCSLRVTDRDAEVSWAYRTITVTGAAPMPGFELWHGPYYHHIDQYLYAQIPASITADGSNRLYVTVTDGNGTSAVLADRDNLAREERLLLENALLDSGSYTVQAELRNAAGTRLSVIREKFEKPYDGAPHVAIDRYNNMYVAGEPYFPVWGKLVKTSAMPGYQTNQAMNTLNCEEWRTSYDIASYERYLTTAAEYGFNVVGPHDELWDGHADPYDDAVRHNEENSDSYKLIEYLEHFKSVEDYPNHVMWTWDDEPNMGNQDYRVPPSVVSAWTHLTHMYDPQRPVGNDLYGFHFLPYYDLTRTTNPNKDVLCYNIYSYLTSAPYYGGKKYWHSDVLGWDIYPVWASTQGQLVAAAATDRVFEEYIVAADRMIDFNRNLIPTIGWVEAAFIPPTDRPKATPEQLIMETWINIVHGSKGVAFFQCKDPDPPVAAMAAINGLVQDLKYIMAAPPSERVITDNANSHYNRVDWMAREYDGATYIIAVRVTELNEPDSPVTASFNVGGYTDGSAVAHGEDRSLTLTGGTFTDTFEPCAVHVYKVTGDPAGITAVRQPVTGTLATLPNPCTAYRLVNDVPNITVHDMNGTATAPEYITENGLFIVTDIDGNRVTRMVTVR